MKGPIWVEEIRSMEGKMHGRNACASPVSAVEEITMRVFKCQIYDPQTPASRNISTVSYQIPRISTRVKIGPQFSTMWK